MTHFTVCLKILSLFQFSQNLALRLESVLQFLLKKEGKNLKLRLILKSRGVLLHNVLPHLLDW